MDLMIYNFLFLIIMSNLINKIHTFTISPKIPMYEKYGNRNNDNNDMYTLIILFETFNSKLYTYN